MKPSMRLQARPLALAALVGAVALLVVAPTGVGLPSGMFKDSSNYPGDFEKNGCTSCHSGATKGLFWPDNANDVTVAVRDAAGQAPAGMVFAKATKYTVNITLHHEQAPEQANHAGFNLRTTAGKFSVPAGNTEIQVSKDGSQATHTNALHTSWTVDWTSPDAGAVHMVVLVNDVNGVGGNDPGDRVYQTFVDLTDANGAQLGAAAKVEAVEYGISLQQYWIGLIGLAGMIFIILAGYVYMKYGSSHNSDAKDR